MEKMSVQQALTELKLIEKKQNELSVKMRLHDYVKTDLFAIVAVKPTLSKEDKIKAETANNKLKGYLDKFYALEDRYVKIKTAINRSNALQAVKIGQEVMTVDEAIVRRRRVKAELNFLEKIIASYRDLEHRKDRMNERENDNHTSHIETLLTERTEGSSDISEVLKALEGFKKEFEVSGDIDRLVELRDKAVEFDSQVDFALTESNVTTMIEVE